MGNIIEFVWGILILLLFLPFVALVIILIGVLISAHLKYLEQKWLPWKKFAAENKLNFYPADLSTGAQVAGVYKDHYVKLEAYKKSEAFKKNSQPYFHLSVSIPRARGSSLWSKGKAETALPLTPEDVIRLLNPDEVVSRPWRRVNVLYNSQSLIYEKPGEELNPKRLQFLMDWLCNIADAYPMIIALGGKVVSPLTTLARRDSMLSPLISQILHDISSETTARLGEDYENLFCAYCLTHCCEHKIHLSWWQTIKFYGCRTCQQSQDFYHSWIVSSLDNTLNEEVSQQNGVVRVNWLARRALFDFDEVEIGRVGDEDVERFAVKVGNDTDPVRTPRYKQIRCVVSAESKLSENTIRILQRMFGSVEVEHRPSCVVNL